MFKFNQTGDNPGERPPDENIPNPPPVVEITRSACEKRRPTWMEDFKTNQLFTLTMDFETNQLYSSVMGKNKSQSYLLKCNLILCGSLPTHYIKCCTL